MIRLSCFLSLFLMFAPIQAESTSNKSTRIYQYQTMVTPKKSKTKGTSATMMKNFSIIHNGHLHKFGFKNNTSEDIKYFERHLWQVTKSDSIFIREKASITEAWSLAKEGISLVNILKQHKVGIEYYPNDFVVLNKKIQWEDVATLVPLSFINEQNQRKKLKFWDYEAVVYEAGNRDITFTITWIPKLKMPAKIVESTMNYEVETILLNSNTLDSINLNTWVDTHTNKVFDFADIGDNENDPVLRKIMDSAAYLGNPHKH